MLYLHKLVLLCVYILLGCYFSFVLFSIAWYIMSRFGSSLATSIKNFLLLVSFLLIWGSALAALVFVGTWLFVSFKAMWFSLGLSLTSICLFTSWFFWDKMKPYMEYIPLFFSIIWSFMNLSAFYWAVFMNLSSVLTEEQLESLLSNLTDLSIFSLPFLLSVQVILFYVKKPSSPFYGLVGLVGCLWTSGVILDLVSSVYLKTFLALAKEFMTSECYKFAVLVIILLIIISTVMGVLKSSLVKMKLSSVKLKLLLIFAPSLLILMICCLCYFFMFSNFLVWLIKNFMARETYSAIEENLESFPQLSEWFMMSILLVVLISILGIWVMSQKLMKSKKYFPMGEDLKWLSYFLSSMLVISSYIKMMLVLNSEHKPCGLIDGMLLLYMDPAVLLVSVIMIFIMIIWYKLLESLEQEHKLSFPKYILVWLISLPFMIILMNSVGLAILS